MKKNMKHPQHSVCFQERPLVIAVRHALPYLVGLSLALAMVQTASSRSSDSAAAFTATQLVRQFTLKNTVSQVSMGMQGYLSEINGEQRAPAMGARPAGFPSDMGSVPATVNLPRRDGAGRPLGYCAWDNAAAVTSADYNAGQGALNPLVYAIVSPGLNGNMQTTCANVLAAGVGVGDDHVQVVAPMQVSSVQYKSAVATFSDLPPGVEGDIRLVRDTNKLYSYVGGAWAPVQAGPFEADAAGGVGAISYTTGKVTVADFQAATATISGATTITGALSGSSATFTGAVTANTFTGNGAGLVDLNAGNFSTGVVSPQFGGTGVNGAAAANGTLLIGNGSGFSLGTLTAGAGIGIANNAGGITITNTLSILGTVDQIIADNSTPGQVLLSLPQAIAPTSMPTFAGMMLNGGLTGTNATFSGAVTVGSLGAQRLDVGTTAGGVTNANMIVGTGAMPGAQSGTGANTALGINALNANITGYANTGSGYRTLELNSSGYGNTANGSDVLRSNTTGHNNTASGYFALLNNTTGFNNSATGRGSGATNTTGSNNTFLGYRADATTGALTFATAIGADSSVATSNTLALGRNSTADQVVIGTDTRNDAVANTKLYVNGVTNLNGDLRGTTATFSGNVTVGGSVQATGLVDAYGGVLVRDGSTLEFGPAGSTSDQVFIQRSNPALDQSRLQIILGDNTEGFGVSTTDEFQIGNNSGGTFTPRFRVAGSGDVIVSGSVTANSFSGNGSALTNLNANNFTAGTLPVARGGTGLSATPTNGQLLIGNGTGYTLGTLTGTANQVNVTNGAGTITLSLPQNIATTSTPTFAGQTLTGGLTGTSASFSSDVTASTLQSFAFKSIASQGAHLQWNRDSANGRTYLINQRGGGSGGISFGESTTGNVYTQNMFLDASGNLTVVGAIAANSASTSTFGGITMAGALTGTSATFSGDVAARHITASGSLQAVGPKAITSQGTHIQWNRSGGDGRTYFVNQRGLGSAGGMSFGEATTGDVYTQNMLLDSVGNLSVVGLVTANSFSGNGSALTNLNANNFTAGTLPVARGGTGLSATPTNGQLLIGNGTGYTLGTLTGTANQVNVTNGAGSITLSLPQSIATTSTPTFGGMTLNGGATVNNSAITFNNVLGDKLNLYSTYGFGINSSNLTAYIPSGAERFSVRTGGTYTGPEVFTVTGGGLITSTGGISTTTGTFSGGLTVTGSSNLNGPVRLAGGAPGQFISIGQDNPGGGTGDNVYMRYYARPSEGENTTFVIGTDSVDAGDHFALMPANGNVGIGTVTPAAKLDVVGTARFSGNTTVGGTLGVTGAATFSSLANANAGLEIATGQELRLGAYGENTDGLFITRVNPAADQSIFRISAFENFDDFGGVNADEFQIGRSAIDRSSFTPVFRLAGSGNAILTGSMTANSFSGNGSALTNLNANNFTAGTLPVARGGTGLSATPANGQLLIGNGTGYTLGTLTGTANQVNVTNGAGTITLSLPQSIATTSTPTFGGMTVNGEVNFNNVVGDKLNLFTSYGFGVNGSNLTAYIPGALQRFSLRTGGTYTGTEVFTVTGGGLITSTGGISTTTGSFSGAVSALSFAGDGSALTNLNAGDISAGTLAVARGGTGLSATPTNGQLLIGNGTGYTLGTLTGTANQVNVTNGAGTITLSLPQSIATTSTPTFGGMTVNGELSFNNVLGDKLNLFGSYGFGINNNNLTAYIPSATQRFSLRTGGTYTGAEVFTVTGGGLITSTGGISTTTGTFSGNLSVGGSLVSNLNVTQGNFVRFGHANQLNGDDGKIGAGLFGEGLNIVGTKTAVAGSREVLVFGNTTVGGTLGVTGNTTVGGTLGVTGATTLSGGMTVNGVATVDSLFVRGSQAIATQGSYLQWNRSGSDGRTYLVNQRGGGAGGMSFGEVTTGNVYTENMALSSTGNLSVVGSVTANSFAGDGSALTNLNAGDISAGTLAVARGGTGLSTTPTNGRLLIGNGTGYTLSNLTAGTGISIVNGAGTITINSTGGGVTSLTGTANQVNVSAATGAVTLSLPQNIATNSTPTFGGMNLSGGLSGTTGAFSGLASAASLQATTATSINQQGAYLQWNKDGGSGRTYLVNQRGGGAGGMSFGEVTTGNAYTENMTLSSTGNLVAAGSISGASLSVSGNVNGNAATFSGTVSASALTSSGNLSVSGAASVGSTLTSGGLLTANAGMQLATGSSFRFGGFNENTDDITVARLYVANDASLLRFTLGDNGNADGLGSDEFQFGSISFGTFTNSLRIAPGSGDVVSRGYMQATSFNATSDRRLKKNITAQNNNSVLERLEQLQTYSYDYINTPSVGRRIGVIAQEIQSLFPEAVSTSAENGMMSVDYNALGAMAAMGVGQLNSKFKVLDGKVNLQGEKLLELDGKLVQQDGRIGLLETWKTAAVTRMDGMQNAIDLNIQKIADNAVAIQTNTKAIERLDDALFTLDGTVKGNTESIANINARWARNFSASEDGSVLSVSAVELKASNFTAQQVRANAVYSQRLEAEIARIADLEVNNIRANSAVANTVQAEQVNTGSVQVYAGVGMPAVLFAAKADGHYTVSTSSLDGSYATATVIVNAGQAKVVSGASEGIELVAEGNMVKAIAAGKSIKASWIKMG